MNDLYMGGLNDDKFSLLYNVENVAIKNPSGQKQRKEACATVPGLAIEILPWGGDMSPP